MARDTVARRYAGALLLSARKAGELEAMESTILDAEAALEAARGAAGDRRELAATLDYLLLEALVDAPHRVLSRDHLLERTHTYDSEVFDRTIDVLILRLRRKIEPNPQAPKLIRTERGAGYVFDADVEKV